MLLIKPAIAECFNEVRIAQTRQICPDLRSHRFQSAEKHRSESAESWRRNLHEGGLNAVTSLIPTHYLPG
jgi:hypothetical protein